MTGGRVSFTDGPAPAGVARGEDPARVEWMKWARQDSDDTASVFLVKGASGDTSTTVDSAGAPTAGS